MVSPFLSYLEHTGFSAPLFHVASPLITDICAHVGNISCYIRLTRDQSLCCSSYTTTAARTGPSTEHLQTVHETKVILSLRIKVNLPHGLFHNFFRDRLTAGESLQWGIVMLTIIMLDGNTFWFQFTMFCFYYFDHFNFSLHIKKLLYWSVSSKTVTAAKLNNICCWSPMWWYVSAETLYRTMEECWYWFQQYWPSLKDIFHCLQPFFQVKPN